MRPRPRSGPPTIEAVDLLRLVLGARGLLASSGAAESAFGPDAGAAARASVRVLAVRQTLQALVTARSGRRSLSAAVDALHAASMLPVIVVAPRRAGRFAVTQIATAVVLATLEVAADRR